jgi:ubiquinol-cytochrome c reductase core subunit 2
MNHEELKLYAAPLKLSNSSRTVQPSKFYSGTELRKETNSSLAYVALAVEGASFNDHKNLVISALVQRALGCEPRTKRGLNAGGKLCAIVGGDVSQKATATAFNVNYSDSGLLGVFIAATPCTVEGV